jgi:spoIIIJ-associated protein
MDQAEASGKTVDDALRAALAKLGVSRDQVEMTVLDEGKKGGLFGRGARDAMVRVELVPGGRAGRDGGAGRSRRGGRGRGAGSTAEERPARTSEPARGRTRQPRSDSGRGRRDDGFVETASPKLTEADFLRGSPPAGQEAEGERAGGGRRRTERPDRPERAERPERREREPRGEREEQPNIDPNIDAEEVDFAASVVDDILRIFNIDAEINLREPMTAGDGRGSSLAVIDIMGEDLGVLIGRRGDTLLNLQYLVNLMLSHRYPGKGGVTIDAEHYRHRREEDIVARATRMADRVRETGDPITMEPMSAGDRRLVHLCLAEDPDVVTESTGAGENRKVVILPRD